ncbi:MAG: histidine kinase [Anaerolineae bacterium]
MVDFFGQIITPRIARWIAWFLVVAYVTLATVGLALQAITNTPYVNTALPVIIIMVILVGVWIVTGALIISRHPQHPVGWLLCAGLFSPAIDMFAAGYAAYDTYVFSGSLPGVDLALVWLKLVNLDPLGLVAFTLIVLLFPDGRFPSPGWRKVVTTVGTLLLFLPLQALEPGSADPLFLPIRTNPLGVSASLWAFLKPLMWTASSILALCYGAAFVSLIVRLRNSRGDVRQQIKWLLFPAGLYGVFLLLYFIGLAKADEVILGISIALGQLAVAGMVIAIAFAIFKYRLYDVDLLINRTLVYGTLTTCVVGLYVLIVGALGTFFQSQGNLIIALLATGIVAVLFQPLRDWLQRGVNRLLYGHRDDPLEALSRLGRQLEAAIDPEIVLPTLAETISRTLKLPYVAISLRSGDDFMVVAESGSKVEEAMRIPLNYQGETVGQLIAGPRGPGESFSQVDRQLLVNIAHQAGPAAYAVQLTEELRQSRVHLVTAREEERRRLRRDLHDGLGPVLASQGLKIAAAGQFVYSDPVQACRLLEELTAQNEATVTAIRRLVYELRPAALDDLGLVGAVRDYADGLKIGVGRSEPLMINVQSPDGDLPALPAAIEVAAYRIATEGLTNIARHARARHAEVSFVLNAANYTRKLHLEIIDDGLGLLENQRPGIGLISMRERAEEIGGHLLIESSPGQGTRVVADLPLAVVP